MGGLAAGIYGETNGYETHVFEMHKKPGGQCASWRRGGHIFDGCIHHLFGCEPASRLYTFWTELGAMPRQIAYHKEAASVESPDGKRFYDYYDLDALEEHLVTLSPADAGVIADYIGAIRLFCRRDYGAAMLFGGWRGKLRMLSALKWFKPTMQQFADRFTDPFLRRAFPLLEYSLPDAPFFIHLLKHAWGLRGDVGWPVGGALEFARSIEKRYADLGGRVHYRQKVVKILTEKDQAVGIRLADGSEHRADIVISNADGRRTIMDLLEGRYADGRIRRLCADPPDTTNWAVHVFLGAERDLSQEPSSLVMLLPEPVRIAGHEHRSLEIQMYGCDLSMAPPGRGVMKFELFSGYSYWKHLYADRPAYEDEKQRVAETVIRIVENRFPGLRGQVETVDVPTLMTWERYMGGTHGFNNHPSKKQNILAGLLGRGRETSLPGLGNFYFVRSWATSGGSLFINALSGKAVIEMICKRDGKRFSGIGGGCPH